MNTTEYAKTVDTYKTLAAKARAGDKQALADKAKAMNDIRSIEREAAGAGKILARAGAIAPRTSPTEKRRPVSASGVVRETSTKRSLQEEYVRRFDDKKMVDLGDGKPTTLREFHSKRLLGR